MEEPELAKKFKDIVERGNQIASIARQAGNVTLVDPSFFSQKGYCEARATQMHG